MNREYRAIQRVYIDTSVIGGCLDSEFSDWSLMLFREFGKGRMTAVVSDLTRMEVAKAPEGVRKVLEDIPDGSLEDVFLDGAAMDLAEAYMEETGLGPGQAADAQHIAMATIHRVNVLASWNFKHIVNLDRIRAFNSVNLRKGHHVLEIRTPREVIPHEEGV